MTCRQGPCSCVHHKTPDSLSSSALLIYFQRFRKAVMQRWTDNSNWQIFIQKSQLELQSNVPLQENALHDLIGCTKNISPPCWLTSTVIFHLFPIADDSIVFTSLHPGSPSIKITGQCSPYKVKKEGVYLSLPMLDMFSTDRKTDSNIVQPQDSSSRLAVDGCSLITWKISGKETGWGHLHIKGAVERTFDDPTSNSWTEG